MSAASSSPRCALPRTRPRAAISRVVGLEILWQQLEHGHTLAADLPQDVIVFDQCQNEVWLERDHCLYRHRRVGGHARLDLLRLNWIVGEGVDGDQSIASTQRKDGLGVSRIQADNAPRRRI